MTDRQIPLIDDNPSMGALEWCELLARTLPILTNPPLESDRWTERYAVLVDGELLVRLIGDREYLETEYPIIYTTQATLIASPRWATHRFVFGIAGFHQLVAEVRALRDGPYRPPADLLPMARLISTVWPVASLFDECRLRRGVVLAPVDGQIPCSKGRCPCG